MNVADYDDDEAPPRYFAVEVDLIQTGYVEVILGADESPEAAKQVAIDRFTEGEARPHWRDVRVEVLSVRERGEQCEFEGLERPGGRRWCRKHLSSAGPDDRQCYEASEAERLVWSPPAFVARRISGEAGNRPPPPPPPDQG